MKDLKEKVESLCVILNLKKENVNFKELKYHYRRLNLKDYIEGTILSHLKNNLPIVLNWNKKYKREWDDGVGPLKVFNVSEIEWNGQFCICIEYFCSDQDCKRCNNDFPIKGHYKIINYLGNDPFGQVSFRETKKQTLININDVKVFDF